MPQSLRGAKHAVDEGVRDGNGRQWPVGGRLQTFHDDPQAGGVRRSASSPSVPAFRERQHDVCDRQQGCSPQQTPAELAAISTLRRHIIA